VSELETLIAKYLDGELSAAEQTELRRTLASNPEAAEIYRELRAIRRAARRAPGLRPPSRATEDALFRQLRLEGLRDTPTPAQPASASASPRRTIAVTASLLLAAFVAIASLVLLRTEAPTANIAVAGRVVSSQPQEPTADATHPSASSSTRAERRASALATTSPIAHASEASAIVSRRHVSGPDSTDAVIAEPSVPSGTNPAVAPPAQANADADSLRTDLAAELATSTPDTARDVASPAILPIVPGRAASMVSANVRFGTSLIDRASGQRADELSAGVTIDLGRGHHLALLGGRAAAVTEERATNTHTVQARASVAETKDGGARLAQVEGTPQPYDVEVGKEWWIGAGYDYSMFASGPFEVGLGVRGGIGPRSLRVGAELPVRLNVSRRFALELVGSATRVVPHDRARSQESIESASDGFVYSTASEHASFSTFGVAAGIRIALD
jgi:hypothetical protein